jgi:hypothetical protein
MDGKVAFRLSCVLAITAMSVGTCPAQYQAPTASRSGFITGQELGALYRRDIGTGYTGSGINDQTLRRIQTQIPNVGQRTAIPGGQIGLNAAPMRTSKPFSSYAPAPTVSPYLNLFRQDLSGNSDFNYQTLVKPMLQQQQFNQQSQRQSYEMARRVQAIAAQGEFNMQGSKDQYPTGHQTAFQYYGRYYPGFQQVRRQQ